MKSAPRPRLLLVAANHKHADEWAKENRVDRSDWKYVGEPSDLRGVDLYSNIFIFTPGWWAHPSASKIETIYETIRRRTTPRSGER